MKPLYSHHPNRTIRAAATLLWVTLMLSPAPGLAAPPAIYHLGTLGGTISGGSAVNDAGQVAGYSYTAGNLAIRAFRYDGTPGSGGVMRDLDTFGGTYSGGHAINNAGQVAGSANLTGDDANHAFRYDGTPGAGGVMHDLDTLDGFYSAGLGINDAGQVAGSRGTRAFRYDGTPGAGGIMHDLGTLGGESYGVAVNDAGQVAGQSHITGSTNFHAFRYDGTPGAGGVMRDLGTLGGTQSYGVAINDAGQVAGLSRITGDTVSHAFLYTGTPGAGGIMHDLGTLGGAESVASGINDAGQVVGRSITGAWFGHAFLYTGTPGVDGQMIDLDTWLDANNSTEGAKWTLTGASGLSNTGWITGAGLYDPDGPGGIAEGTRAYLLDASSLVSQAPDLPGDYNHDGAVDAADYVVWRKNGGTQDEYNTWRANFGSSLGPGSGAAGYPLGASAAPLSTVPEPWSLALLTLAGSALLLRRRRREQHSIWAVGYAGRSFIAEPCPRARRTKTVMCYRSTFRSLMFIALTALTLIVPAPAAAIDTEPLNNSQLTADSLPLLLPGTAVSNFARLGGAGGDVDFFQTELAAGEVLFGMVTPLAGLPSGAGLPETMVSVFDDSGRRTFNELEDIGEGEGSLFRFESPAAAMYRIGVSGCCDFAFDGAASGFSHAESGGYVLTAGRINPAIPGGGFTDTDPANQTAAGADLIPVTRGTARVAVAQLAAGDVDFFRLDVKRGDVLSAMTAPLGNLGVAFDSPDTLLGLFDSSGTNLLVENDDAGGETSITIMNSETGEFDSTSGSSDFPFNGASWGSALRAFMPADGTYYLAVTGYGDLSFAGAHSESGSYALLVGVAAVPEPSSLALLTFAALALLVRHCSYPHRTARRCW